VIGLSRTPCGPVAAAAPAPRVTGPWRADGNNPDVEFHEHAIEPTDEVPLEPLSPHPGSDPVEVSTEPRTEHPERRPPRTRGVTRARRMQPSR
jgi:hypothetical protein